MEAGLIVELHRLPIGSLRGVYHHALRVLQIPVACHLLIDLSGITDEGQNPRNWMHSFN